MPGFADEALITVSSGKGGNGCVSFRREAFVPKGGPAGGDGGRGGSLVFSVRRNLRTLVHLRYQKVFRAENGRDGEGSARYGRKGEDCVVPLPPGSIIRDADTGAIVRDFGKDESDFVFLKGGNGGWGNIHFKSSVNQAPRKALAGQEGQTAVVKVELRIIADIGFVGFPNAGKSSLLDYFTNARPKIAPYPFTTKIPNLGVLKTPERDLILADIPGIIEGASEGAGLGIRFLKHISRAGALAFLIDLSDDNFLDAFPQLLKELEHFDEQYGAKLLAKKRLLVGTKLDMDGTTERLDKLRAAFSNESVYGISVFSRSGLEELAREFMRLTADETSSA
jgi:GTP-binding protein